jgi:riboflavin synthase
MFTGIVEEVGRVRSIQTAPGLTRLHLEAQRVLPGLTVGDSVALNGACLTVVARDEGSFAVEATPETLRRTNLGQLQPRDGVHLERPLAAGDRLGGHFVQGHVDAVGTIAARRPEGEAVLATFTAPAEVLRYVVPKGSIAVDGVSLTVVDVLPDGFTVALIPHTQQVTLLTEKPLGSPVNLEADILAKYVARAAGFERELAVR